MKNESSTYLSMLDVVKSIRLTYEYDMFITTIHPREEYKMVCTPINKTINRLLNERKELAKRYIEHTGTPEKKENIIELFSAYNKEIIKLLGLNTIEK